MSQQNVEDHFDEKFGELADMVRELMVHMNARFDAIEARFDKLNLRFEQMIERLERRLEN